MVKDKKTKSRKNIQLDIKRAFVVIDNYLPKQYTAEVLTKLPWATKNQIRTVKSRKSGDLRIIRALKEVADESKEIITQ